MQARDLHPHDLDGLADPVVKVEVMGQKKHTRVHKQTVNCVFDQTLFFNFKNVSREEFEAGVVKVSVFDAGTLGRDTLIGLCVDPVP